eukprot:348437-Alexandrium_andersonii.AAC.1
MKAFIDLGLGTVQDAYTALFNQGPSFAQPFFEDHSTSFRLKARGSAWIPNGHCYLMFRDLSGDQK